MALRRPPPLPPPPIWLRAHDAEGAQALASLPPFTCLSPTSMLFHIASLPTLPSPDLTLSFVSLFLSHQPIAHRSILLGRITVSSYASSLRHNGKEVLVLSSFTERRHVVWATATLPAQINRKLESASLGQMQLEHLLALRLYSGPSASILCVDPSLRTCKHTRGRGGMRSPLPRLTS